MVGAYRTFPTYIIATLMLSSTSPVILNTADSKAIGLRLVTWYKPSLNWDPGNWHFSWSAIFLICRTFPGCLGLEVLQSEDLIPQLACRLHQFGIFFNFGLRFCWARDCPRIFLFLFRKAQDTSSKRLFSPSQSAPVALWHHSHVQVWKQKIHIE